ncbi:phosphatidate cytidylyltransferase [Amylibacter ulvae]|uniref:Phosphatidate cytidylyltransferase n=2 Tax=Paramylibacter ulvae TaxID=1651968 RepID=A0ABQ3CY67_9RHOB|nr:phosphatidate cytidylyltransferase [Amylibacter ulvae]
MVAAQQHGLAIIAGRGDLPKLLAEECARRNEPYLVIGFGNAALKWAVDHPFETAQFEKAGALFDTIRNAGCDRVVFAGAMSRPSLNPLKYDWKFTKLAPRLLKSLGAGDDETLRTIASVFHEEGFEIIGADTVLENLVAKLGIPTKRQPTDIDRADAKRARDVVKQLGLVDVGQGCVVANGICLALETIQGTDAMLEFVYQTAAPYRHNADAGVLYKAPKPNQDRRIDFPAIGTDTIRTAHHAGLNGVVVPDGGALIIDLRETVKMADELNLFLWIQGADE